MKKRFPRHSVTSLICIASFLLLCAIPSVALVPKNETDNFGGGAVNVYVNGRCLYEDAPLIVHDTTYVSLDAFQKAVGDTTSVITARDHILEAEERAIYLPYGTILYHGEPYLPIRALSKLYGYNVAWEGETSTVRISGTASRVRPQSEVYDSSSLYWLSRIIYAESGSEPLTGQLAVGTVVMNRVASSSYPNTIYGVIFDRKFGVQFTPIANGTIYRTPSELSVTAAKMTLEGYSVSNRILYFIQEEIATSHWVSENCIFVMRIGCHDFYA